MLGVNCAKGKPLGYSAFLKLNKMKKDDSWLRPRGYVHFTKKFSRHDQEACKFLTSYVSTTSTVAKHSFFPLIHKPIITRRYKKIGRKDDGTTIRSHSSINNTTGTKESNAKIRHIYYSTHIDAYIYSYYCKEILEPLYEAKVKQIDGLTDCISAYRKIPVKKGACKNKNNVYFANDVFKFIKNYGDCVVLTFDVSAFFDSLNQKCLKQQWCSLLGTQCLPDDHYNIFKSLTRISYVEYYKLLKKFEIKNPNKLKNSRFISFCPSIKDFHNKVQAGLLIKHHPFTRKPVDEIKIEYVGIPQGTPISAFLSNLYLLEFDKLMLAEIGKKQGGLYRRYSDDIVIVCNTDSRNEVEEMVINTIKNKFDLTINAEKVETSTFVNINNRLVCDRPLRYLGFEFNGSQILLKGASLSKFYRQLKYSVKAQARRAKHNKWKKGPIALTARIYKQDLFKRFSHLSSKGKRRSFFGYAKDASKIMKEKSIIKQLSNSWKILDTGIKKYEKKYKL